MECIGVRIKHLIHKGLEPVDQPGDKKMPSRVGTEKSLLCLLLVVVLVRGLLYAAIIPPWQAPDEPAYFAYARLLAQWVHVPATKRLSAAFEQELVASLYEWHYGEFTGSRLPAGMPTRLRDLPRSNYASRSVVPLGGRPSLPYIWQALFLLPVRHQDLVLQLYMARVSSVLLGMGVVWLAWKTFRELLPRSTGLVAAMTALVVFLPQHTFISSAVSDGLLAELAAGLVFYAWARLFRHGIGVWLILEVLLGTVVGIWSKPTALFLLPFNVLALAMILYQRRQRSWNWRHVAYLLATFAVLMGIGWLAVREPVGRPIRQLLERLQAGGAQLDLLYRHRMSLGRALLRTYWGFWAWFGWLDLPVSSGWYLTIYVASLAALAGWAMPGRKMHPWWVVGLMATAWLLAILVVVASFVRALLGSQWMSYQGRYLFAAIVPFAFLFVGGWARLLPLRFRPFVSAAVVVGMVWFDAVCLLCYIVPFYYSY
jgi:hypothetical protein